MSIPINPATTEAKLHDLIANRWSPRSFDPTHIISSEEMNSLLEAARWSPSWNNDQPWRFLFGHRGDKNFEGFVSTLKDFNLVWAPNASALILICATGKKVTKIETFDTGLAVGAITFQGLSMGFHTRQMGGFEKDKISEMFSLPENVEPIVLIAVGKIKEPVDLSEDFQKRENAPRSRKPLSELILKGLN